MLLEIDLQLCKYYDVNLVHSCLNLNLLVLMKWTKIVSLVTFVLNLCHSQLIEPSQNVIGGWICAMLDFYLIL